MKNRCTELFHTNQLLYFKTRSHSSLRSSYVILINSVEYKHYDSTLIVSLTILQRKNMKQQQQKKNPNLAHLVPVNLFFCVNVLEVVTS